MISTHVSPAASTRRRSDLQGTVGPEKSAFAQILSQGSLYDNGKGRGSLLGSQILVHCLRQVIGKSHSGSFHESSLPLTGDDGEDNEVGDIGEHTELLLAQVLTLRSPGCHAPSRCGGRLCYFTFFAPRPI